MKTKGFTLIELLIVICITSIIAGAIGMIFTNTSYHASDQRKKLVMQQNGRSALNFIANELLMAGYSPIPGNVGIQTAGLNQMTFTCDLNANGNTGDANENITLSFNNTSNQLQFTDNNNNSGSGGPQPIPILDNVAACRFLYAYDTEGLGTTGYGKLETDSSDNIQWTFDFDTDGILDKYYTFTNNNISELIGTESLKNKMGKALPISRIRAVKIILLVRTRAKRLLSLQNTDRFNLPGLENVEPSSGLDNNFNYKIFTTNIKLRNMYYL